MQYPPGEVHRGLSFTKFDHQVRISHWHSLAQGDAGFYGLRQRWHGRSREAHFEARRGRTRHKDHHGHSPRAIVTEETARVRIECSSEQPPADVDLERYTTKAAQYSPTHVGLCYDEADPAIVQRQISPLDSQATCFRTACGAQIHSCREWSRDG